MTMAQIHALTPDGRLPSAAIEHVEEIAVPRNTGWRDVSAWVPNRVSGRLLIRRTGLELIVVLDELVVSVDGRLVIERFPAGLRPLFIAAGEWTPSTGAERGGKLTISAGGYCNVYDVVAGQAMTARITGDFSESYQWPSPVPGTPA